MADFSIEDTFEGDVCGADEVGRGPLCGPVVAAAVIIPKQKRNLEFVKDIRDSKKLSTSKRLELYQKIIEHFPYAVTEISAEEIDRINILQASLLAMKQSCECLKNISHVLVDGNKIPKMKIPATAVVKGDQKSKSIAAASIIAKVHRDKIMKELAQLYPQYGWEKNSGYPTEQHRAALKKFGITPHHRKSYAPVRALLESDQ